MQKNKQILTSVIVVTFVLLILANLLHGVLRIVAWVAMLFSLAVFAVLWSRLWRCPKCGKHLGRLADGEKVCPHCGEPLE